MTACALVPSMYCPLSSLSLLFVAIAGHELWKVVVIDKKKQPTIHVNLPYMYKAVTERQHGAVGSVSNS